MSEMAAASDRGGGGGARPRHPADVERGKMSFSSGKKPTKFKILEIPFNLISWLYRFSKCRCT